MFRNRMSRIYFFSYSIAVIVLVIVDLTLNLDKGIHTLISFAVFWIATYFIAKKRCAILNERIEAGEIEIEKVLQEQKEMAEKYRKVSKILLVMLVFVLIAGVSSIINNIIKELKLGIPISVDISNFIGIGFVLLMIILLTRRD